MEAEYCVFPEEEFFPEAELLAVEKVDEVSQRAAQDSLMDIVNGLETYDVIAYNSSYNNEENINLNIEMLDDPYNILWQNQITPNSSELLWIQNKDNNFPALDIELSDPDWFHTINQYVDSKLKGEETVDIKEEAVSTVTDNNEMVADIKAKTEQETKGVEFKMPSNSDISSSTLCKPVLSQEINKRNTNIKKKNQNAKGKKNKKELLVKIKDVFKPEEQEDCVDVETIPRDEVPVLEAVDVKSLLEQFEASENPNLRNKSTVKNNRTYDTRSNKPCQVIQECRTNVSEKSVSQVSTQQEDVYTLVSKRVIDKLKASRHKRTIPIIPAMPNIQGGNRSTSIRTQAVVPRNKILKTSSTVTNNAKSKTFNSALVQLDHDYCANVPTKSNSNKTTKHTSILKSSQNNCDTFEKHQKDLLYRHMYCNSKSVKVYDVNRQSHKSAILQEKIKNSLLENNYENCQKETALKQSHVSSNSSSIKNININSNESPKFSSKLQMDIRSPLAKKILQSRGILPKINIAQTNLKTQHMVSLLKNPPNVSQSSFSTNNSNENIVTTTNSLNNEVQNIIVQNTQNTLQEEVKTDPPRKKLNLTEYLNRKNKNTIPKIKSPMVLVYVYHAATKTELVVKDDPNNPEIWCEREIVSVLKDRLEIKEEKNKPKPPTCDAMVQTYETMFSTNTVEDVEINEKREENTKNEIQESCKRVSRSRSKSKSRNKTNRSKSRSRSRSRRRSKDRRSRSRSKSRSRSRNRNRSRNINTRNRSTTRSRSRSRSCRRSDTRRRTISHRRSSVSSSSWSSRSPFSTRYTYSCSRSRSRIRSRSRSRSRSRCRSRSRSKSSSSSRSFGRQYSSRSRSSSSNFGRNRWSSHRRRDNSDHERNYDRYGRHSFINHNYRSCSRSPLHSYHKPCDNWYNREKQREVEERRVIYVGRLDEGITKADLRRRFEIFGPVVDISVHFRERGDNYGFVTFLYNTDAYTAVEHGNDNPSLPRYDLCFGGRRAFCKSNYADLDDMRSSAPISRLPPSNEENTFDYLLEEAKAQLRKRKV